MTGKIRQTLAAMQTETVQVAKAFIADRLAADEYRFLVAHPDTQVPLSRVSKHPTAWVVVFAPVPPAGSVIDGGELFVAVNLEANTVELRS